jgi:hypothetical protein
MIITKIQGGIGNQLFQYAVGRSLTEQYKVPLKFDIEWYKTSEFRRFLLDKFNISGEIATIQEIQRLNPEGFFAKTFTKKSTFTETEDRFYDELLHLSGNAYLNGYWQSEKYFKNIEHILRKEFVLKESLPSPSDALVDHIQKTNSVSVHIRRGDYMAPKNIKTIGLLSPDYYSKAVELITKETSNPQFFIFSDDLDFAKTLSFPESSVYVTSDFGLEDYEELMVMSKCKHNILANSSFSWWAAWLNQNPSKTTIAPKNWFVSKTTDDLVPNEWRRI